MRNSPPLVIAHRGACGYLPEHTLAAKAMAHTMGADFIEQDVVLTRDGVPIVLHDIYLDSTTNVAEQFPDRARQDGRFHAMDFDLEEIRRLGVRERCHTDPPRSGSAVFPQRFPAGPTLFRVPTLEEEITLLAGLDHSRQCKTGLYIEMKAPDRHLASGLDLTAAVLQVLKDTGYANRVDQVFLQCFDDRALRRIREEGLSQLPMIQLIGENDWGEDSEADYDQLRTPEGLDYVAGYARGIGPFLPHIYLGKDSSGEPQLSGLVTEAQSRGLEVHPYTFRRDELPDGIDSFTELLDIFVRKAGVDALFTDFPDLVTDYLEHASSAS